MVYCVQNKRVFSTGTTLSQNPEREREKKKYWTRVSLAGKHNSANDWIYGRSMWVNENYNPTNISGGDHIVPITSNTNLWSSVWVVLAIASLYRFSDALTVYRFANFKPVPKVCSSSQSIIPKYGWKRTNLWNPPDHHWFYTHSIPMIPPC